jgi:hypothetical protein
MPLGPLTPSELNRRSRVVKGPGRVQKHRRVVFATVASPKPSAGHSLLVSSFVPHVPVVAFLAKMAEAKAGLPGPQRSPFPARLKVLVDRKKEVVWLSYLQVRNHVAAELEMREKLCLTATPLYSGIGKTALGRLVQAHLRSDEDTQELVVKMVLESLAGPVEETKVRDALQDFIDAAYKQIELPRVADDETFAFNLRLKIFKILGGTPAAFLDIKPNPESCGIDAMLAHLQYDNTQSFFVHFDELDLSESQAELFIQFAFDNFLLCPGRYMFCTGHSATLWKRAIDTRNKKKSPCTAKLIPISALSQNGILGLLAHLRSSSSSNNTQQGFCTNIDPGCLEYLSKQLKLKTGGVSLIVVESLRVLHCQGKISTQKAIDELLGNDGVVLQQVLRVERVRAELEATSVQPELRPILLRALNLASYHVPFSLQHEVCSCHFVYFTPPKTISAHCRLCVPSGIGWLQDGRAVGVARASHRLPLH